MALNFIYHKNSKTDSLISYTTSVGVSYGASL